MEEVQIVTNNLPVEPVDTDLLKQEAEVLDHKALVETSHAKKGSNVLRRKQEHLVLSQANLQNLKDPALLEKIRLILERVQDIKDMTKEELEIFQQFVREFSNLIPGLKEMSLEQVINELQKKAQVQGLDDVTILPDNNGRSCFYEKKVMEFVWRILIFHLLGIKSGKDYEYAKLMLSNLMQREKELRDMGPRAIQIELLMMEFDARYKIYEDRPGIPSETPAKEYMEFIQSHLWILMEESIDDPKTWQFYEELFNKISANLEELERMSPDEAMETLQQYRNQLYFDIFYIKN